MCRHTKAGRFQPAVNLLPWTAGAILLALGICPWREGFPAEIAFPDGHGRIRALSVEGDLVEVQTDIRVFTTGWKNLSDLGRAKEIKFEPKEGRQRWTGRIEVEPSKFYRYEQVLEQTNGGANLSIKVTAEAEVGIEGVFLWVHVPHSVFAGGRCELWGETNQIRTASFPVPQPDEVHFLSAMAGRAVLESPGGSRRAQLSVDRPLRMTFQDNRKWREETYSVYVNFAPQPLAAGQSATLDARLEMTGSVDRSPVRLTVNPAKTRYRFDGFGGNYCFNIESPVTQYTLDHLRVAWARTEMTLSEWEPANDNESPDDIRWEILRGHDKPGSNLRREFELARQIEQRRIPSCISIWRLPEWMYTDPGKGPEAHRRRVAPDQWPEVRESIGSYLLHARDEYGVEPDLFSFNEADEGVRVLLSAEEHREAIRQIGAHLEKLGLKTKMLLGDVCTADANRIQYVRPTLEDPAAMRHVGAIAFHSWGGASPATYAAWADLAEKHRLPLLVTEVGVDSGAWRTAWEINTFYYALREMRMYQELLLHARPRALMRWEFTGDYGMVSATKNPGTKTVEMTPWFNYWPVKHICNLTPPDANALETSSSSGNVWLTAFRGRADGRTAYTLHIANLGASRTATIAGVPSGIGSLRAIVSSETEQFRDHGLLPVRRGKILVELPAHSFLTVTTMEVK